MKFVIEKKNGENLNIKKWNNQQKTNLEQVPGIFPSFHTAGVWQPDMASWVQKNWIWLLGHSLFDTINPWCNSIWYKHFWRGYDQNIVITIFYKSFCRHFIGFTGFDNNF